MNAAGAGGDINGWILAVNLIIWTGIFLYLVRLSRKLRDVEKDQ